MGQRRREGFYTSLANGVLWPAMHEFPTIAEIADAPWHHYEAANQAFANAVLDVVSDNELVWLHDDPIAERRRRMGALRKTVRSLDVDLWARGFLQQLVEVRPTAPPAPYQPQPSRPASSFGPEQV